ncbi:DUF3592 domain-containing protein [Streptomyces polygonati]|uniref:DUF3592 domain-containing protein n=1 Tax=Streptomyces polygonati TaxID=1617087 RepID=A0ABV8HQL7_9ACTN
MAYDIVLGIWCAVVGVPGMIWAGRYAARGPWRRLAVARVLRVWEPEPGEGWSRGVPAEVGYVDPAGGREMVGITRGGGGRAGNLAAAWPGREVVAYARLRRPDDFRVADRSPRPADGYLAGTAACFVLTAVPLASRALLGRHSLAGALGTSAGAVAVAFLVPAAVLGIRNGRRRRALLAEPELTTAHVIDLKESRQPDAKIGADKAMTPVFSFTTSEGSQVTAVSGYELTTRRLRPGDEVPLRYAAADPSVFAVDGVDGVDGEGTGGPPADGAGLDKARVWVRADGIRLRADRITAVRVSEDGLLLHTLDHGSAIPLTPAAPETSGTQDVIAPGGPAERRSHLERLADEFLGRVEDHLARRRGVLIVFEAADARHEAGFTVLDLPGLRPTTRRRERQVRDNPPPARAASVPGTRSPALMAPAAEPGATAEPAPPAAEDPTDAIP